MWIPIALSGDVPGGVTRAVQLGGEELVAWRGHGGSLQVWEDRCPHRGMRLSFGFVRGDSLNCLYHGWEYGAGASCRRIPAHPDLAVPATIKAKAFRSIESGGMVLVQRDDGGESQPDLPEGAPVATVVFTAESETLFHTIEARPLAGVSAFETTLDGLPLTIGWHVPRAGHVMLHAVTRDAALRVQALAALYRLRTVVEGRSAA